jgi:hypothetical protein
MINRFSVGQKEVLSVGAFARLHITIERRGRFLAIVKATTSPCIAQNNYSGHWIGLVCALIVLLRRLLATMVYKVHRLVLRGSLCG